MCVLVCVRACDSLMVGGERAALHAKLTPQAVRVSLHGTQKRTHWFERKAGRSGWSRFGSQL